jgi:hypothetical protein
MALRLLPRDEVFFDLFNQAAQNTLQAARMLKELLDDYRDVAQRAEAIKSLEDKGDEITHTIIERLNRTFVAPLDREDIFALAKQLDDVLDWIEASSARMAVYQIPHSTSEAQELAQRALAKSITQVCFDRNGYRFHGRLKGLAEAAREAGLKF